MSREIVIQIKLLVPNIENITMISSMSLNGGNSGRVERHRGAETQELSGWEVGEST